MTKEEFKLEIKKNGQRHYVFPFSYIHNSSCYHNLQFYFIEFNKDFGTIKKGDLYSSVTINILDGELYAYAIKGVQSFINKRVKFEVIAAPMVKLADTQDLKS